MSQQYHKAFFQAPGVGHDAYHPELTAAPPCATATGPVWHTALRGPFGIEPYVPHLMRHTAWHVPVDHMPAGACPCAAGFLAGGY